MSHWHPDLKRHRSPAIRPSRLPELINNAQTHPSPPGLSRQPGSQVTLTGPDPAADPFTPDTTSVSGNAESTQQAVLNPLAEGNFDLDFGPMRPQQQQTNVAGQPSPNESTSGSNGGSGGAGGGAAGTAGALGAGFTGLTGLGTATGTLSSGNNHSDSPFAP